MKAVVKIDIGTIEIGETGGINQQLNTLTFEQMIVGLRPVEGHAIFKARAAASLDKYPQFLFQVALAGMHQLNLARGAWSES